MTSLASSPDANPEDLERVLVFLRALPHFLRGSFQSIAKTLPPDPGGRPSSRSARRATVPAPPPTGQQGDFGRNVLRGFGASQVDLAVQRQFHVTERLRLNFRSEFFNIFNHPNFGSPNNHLTSPLLGQSTQTLASSLGSGGRNGGLNPLYQIGGPRSIQLALKLQF